MAIAQTKNRVGGLGIFAEIETIQPKLERHRREFRPQFSASISGVFPAIFSQLGIKSPPSPQVSQSLVAQTVSQSLENIGRVQTIEQIPQVVADALTQSIVSQEEIAKGQTAAQIYEKIQEASVQIVTENQKGLEEEAVLANIAQIASLEKPDQETQSIIAQGIQSTVDSLDPLMPPDEQTQLFESIASYLAENRESLNDQLADYSEDNLPSLEQFQEIKQKAHDQAISQIRQTSGNVDIRQLAADIGAELGTKPLDGEQADKFGLGFAQPTRDSFNAQGLEGKMMGLRLESNGEAQEEAVSALILHDKEETQKAERYHNPQHFHFVQNARNHASNNPKKAQKYLAHFQKLNGGTTKASQTVWRTVRAYTNYYPGFFVPQTLVSSRVLSYANMGSLAKSYGSFSVGNVVSGARGLSSGLKSAIGFGKTAKGAIMAGKLALGASNPAGWAMLAAQALPFLKKHAAKIIAGAIGLGLLLWLMLAKLLAKIAAIATGAATGAVIGFVVGGPVGAVIGGLIGAGTGWVISNWAVPISNFVGSVFSALGSAASSVGLAINSLGSAIASGAGSVFSGSVAAFGGFSNAVLSLGSISVSGSAIFAPLMIGTGAIGIGSILIGTITATSFFSAAGDLTNIAGGDNEFFTVTKTANPTRLENTPQGETAEVSFTITLSAKNSKLTAVEITDEMKVQGLSTFAVTQDKNSQPISPITSCQKDLNPNESCSHTFTTTINELFTDSIISNIVTVKATPEGKSPVQDSAIATATIGKPKITNPSGWPTCGQIFQGSWTSPPLSHSDPGYRSSIDIHDSHGTKIYSTHGGTVIAAQKDSTGAIYVAVQGEKYISFYVHLLGIAPGITRGSNVSAETLLGYMDTTGSIAASSHLHYMIRDANNKEISKSDFDSLVPSYKINDKVNSTWGPC